MLIKAISNQSLDSSFCPLLLLAYPEDICNHLNSSLHNVDYRFCLAAPLSVFAGRQLNNTEYFDCEQWRQIETRSVSWVHIYLTGTVCPLSRLWLLLACSCFMLSLVQLSANVSLSCLQGQQEVLITDLSGLYGHVSTTLLPVAMMKVQRLAC